MTSKTFCVTCDTKDINGIFKCEGCSQTFCLKHTNRHRDFLNYQLDEIILEHDNLLNTSFNDNKQQSSFLLDQINQWEKDSIIQIQQIAEQTRIQLKQLADFEIKNTKEKFSQLGKELEKARENDEYLEKDLFRWKILLEQFQYNLTILSPSITVYQDQNEKIINKIFISKINQNSILNETLLSYSDQIQIDDKHHIAMHCGPYRTPAYITGTNEYSSGQHSIRLFISKTSNDFILSFNIISKFMPIPPTSVDSQFFSYGWQSDDCINPSHLPLTNQQNFHDLKGQTKLHLELFLDCNNQTISYFNQTTKRKREIIVDLEKCPLPWKLCFYLYDVGDCIRLLSSSHIS